MYVVGKYWSFFGYLFLGLRGTMGGNIRIVMWFNVFSGVITYLLYHNLTFEKEQKLY